MLGFLEGIGRQVAVRGLAHVSAQRRHDARRVLARRRLRAQFCAYTAHRCSGRGCEHPAGALQEMPSGQSIAIHGASPLQKMIFSASWIWRAVVCVLVIWPALSIRPPSSSKSRVSPQVPHGAEKFVRFRTLKISARSCTFTRSDPFLMKLFLKNDMSRFTSPGPTTEFRRTLPSVVTGLGIAKQSVLM